MADDRPTYFLGCISGTSVDGLDLAILQISETKAIEFIASDTVSFPEPLQHRLLKLGQPTHDNLDELGWADAELGEFIGVSIKKFLNQQNISAEDISAIGSHGQTVRHRPSTSDKPLGFSTQIGDPNRIAEITGITTVADFRRRDMAAGGQGAPLVPPFHQALLGHRGDNIVVLNIGGISNVSILGDPPSGFDTGPGNGLMDSWHQTHRGQSYDEAGAWAAQGQVDEGLLNQCLADPYFQQPPPKSTGREYFTMDWLSQQLQSSNAAPVDVQATLAMLTARCTSDALKLVAPKTEHIVVCGGGRLNQHVMQCLQSTCQANVIGSEAWDIDGDSLEAGLFAWLAFQTIAGLPGNEPAVTGASAHRVLGAIYPGCPN